MKSDNDASIGITSLIPPARALRAALLDRRDHTSSSGLQAASMGTVRHGARWVHEIG